MFIPSRNRETEIHFQSIGTRNGAIAADIQEMAANIEVNCADRRRTAALGPATAASSRFPSISGKITLFLLFAARPALNTLRA